jgi:hypothetical protein
MEEKVKFPSGRRWLEYLAAVLIGNAAYFICFVPHLPAGLQHQAFRVDWGLVLDFLVCASMYGLIRLGSWV